MVPGKCVVCKRSTGFFYVMKKADAIKEEVCPLCKYILEKLGWVVVNKCMH